MIPSADDIREKHQPDTVYAVLVEDLGLFLETNSGRLAAGATVAYWPAAVRDVKARRAWGDVSERLVGLLRSHGYDVETCGVGVNCKLDIRIARLSDG